ncbi:MAG: hypothetical protein HY718_20940 [Planctomycetes bacterium]|nr:hypothetical protein [Planctomycetota bacterium]
MSDTKQPEPAAMPTCPICGTEMYGVHCKRICPNCGYLEDCGDLFPDPGPDKPKEGRPSAPPADGSRDQRAP